MKQKWFCVLLVCLVIVVSVGSVVVTELNAGPVILQFSSDQSSRFFVVGDVRQVLIGNLTASSYSNVSTSNIMMAIGAGAFGSITRTGEMLIFDGKAFVKSSDPATNYSMEVSNAVMTPFCVGLMTGASPTAVYVLESNAGYSVDALYRTLSQKYGRLFAVFGVGQFGEIDPSAIKLAPIYHESLLDPSNKAKYYHNLSPILDRVGVFFGVVNNPNKPPAGYDVAVEQNIFYVNPTDQGSLTIQSHTHILVTTNESISYPSEYSGDTALSMARTLQVVGVYHLLTQSVLRKAIIAVYALNTRAPLTALGAEVAILPVTAPLALWIAQDRPPSKIHVFSAPLLGSVIAVCQNLTR